MKSKKSGSQFFKGGPKNFINFLFVGLLLIGTLVLLNYLTQSAVQLHVFSYSQFLKKVEENAIKNVFVAGQNAEGDMRDGSKFRTVLPVAHDQWDLLRSHDVEIVLESDSGNTFFWFIVILGALGLVIGLFWYLLRQIRNGSNSPGNMFPLSKSRAKMFMPSSIKENFDSVAGVVEAKEELKDIIDFLKNPSKFRRLGAKITRGVLLVGEPGNGKTMLAKAVAGEANCPFFSISGSDFIEIFVGVGAGRVRDLFAQARKYAPSIIFIDELDAVGRHRGNGMGGGHDEREQTLNQLLTEMDGFQTKEGAVIVLAATNRPDVLDKALLRPGRFDRRVVVPYPDLASREQILKVHAKGVPIDTSVDLAIIARGTPGFSGADLASLVNEAAIAASKNNQDLVTIQDFEMARDKIVLGKEVKSMVRSKEELRVTAFHEAGHTMLTLLQPEHTDPLHKVSIVPRGRSLGVTYSFPEKDKYMVSKQEMEANMLTLMGGRAAEEITFGSITTGASRDFETATEIARDMVCRYGMSDLGKVVYAQHEGSFAYSQKTAEQIDLEVKCMIDASYAKAIDMLKTHYDKLNILAETLLERETMHAGEIYTLLGIESRQEHRFV
jgi:cell division protease FtsH